MKGHDVTHLRLKPNRPRISVAALMVLVAGIAIDFAAFLYPSLFWSLAAGGAFLAFLCTAILGVIHRRGRDQSFWVGNALFGWAYLIVTLIVGIFDRYRVIEYSAVGLIFAYIGSLLSLRFHDERSASETFRGEGIRKADADPTEVE